MVDVEWCSKGKLRLSTVTRFATFHQANSETDARSIARRLYEDPVQDSCEERAAWSALRFSRACRARRPVCSVGRRESGDGRPRLGMRPWPASRSKRLTSAVPLPCPRRRPGLADAAFTVGAAVDANTRRSPWHTRNERRWSRIRNGFGAIRNLPEPHRGFGISMHLEMADQPRWGHFIAIVVRGGLRNSATARATTLQRGQMTHRDQPSTKENRNCDDGRRGAAMDLANRCRPNLGSRPGHC